MSDQDLDAPLFVGTQWTLRRVWRLAAPVLRSPETMADFLIAMMRNRPSSEPPTAETVDRLVALVYIGLWHNVLVDKRLRERRRPRAAIEDAKWWLGIVNDLDTDLSAPKTERAVYLANLLAQRYPRAKTPKPRTIRRVLK
jgi:hypothetical protein